MTTTRSFSAGLAALLLAANVAPADVASLSARPSPDWLRSATIYEIFPRHFSPAGNLAGVTAKLDELKDLGVTVLWTMPIHPIGEKLRKGEFGSPYSIKDYCAIDPNYGTLDDFKKLVDGAHARGMKVIMDIVANHTSWDSVMLEAPKPKPARPSQQRGMMHFLGQLSKDHPVAANEPWKLPRPDFYKHDGQGRVIPPMPDWSDVAGLNYTNNAPLHAYMIDMLKYWLQTADVDGFRCDVAWGVPLDFWEEARAELTKVKPNIMMLGEADIPTYLVKAFDVDYSWDLMHALNDVMLKGAPATKLRESWEKTSREFPQGSLHLRISDNHDETRAVARFGCSGALAASVLMFTLDGIPLLYNGMEVGDATESGDPALFEKLTIGWHPHQSDRPPLRKVYQDLVKLRKDHSALRTAQVNWLGNSAENNVVSFTRKDDREEILVLVNFSNRPVSGSINNLDAAAFKPVTICGVSDAAAGDLPRFQLDGFGWRIYSRATPK